MGVGLLEIDSLDRFAEAAVEDFLCEGENDFGPVDGQVAEDVHEGLCNIRREVRQQFFGLPGGTGVTSANLISRKKSPGRVPLIGERAGDLLALMLLVLDVPIELVHSLPE